MLNWLIAGHKGAIVGIALHKGMDGVAVGGDTGPHDLAMLILEAHRRLAEKPDLQTLIRPEDDGLAVEAVVHGHDQGRSIR